MLHHARLLASISSSCWAIEERWGATFLQIASRRIALEEAPSPAALGEAAEIRAARDARRGQQQAISAGIYVIPIIGTIVQRASMYSEVSGCIGCQQISAQLSAALANESVSSILLEIDSPGGDVCGVEELAAEIYAARAKKPVVAFANSLAASAAYWLGSQASEFMVTPSGQVGSIGVFAVHENWAEAAKQAGVETTFVYAGKYKTEGNDLAPLGTEAKGHMQGLVDGYYASFTRGVARGRGVDVAAVRNGMGQGRVLNAAGAKSARMVDSVGAYGAAIARARQLGASPSAAARALNVSPEFKATVASRMDERNRYLDRIEREILLSKLESDERTH